MSPVLENRQGSAMSEMHLSPPYPPTNAALGGVPSIIPDVPLCVIFLVFYVAGAISHMTILQINSRRGHKFLISGMLFGFCMSRIATMVMRIVWATRPKNIPVAIAANVFVQAGIVLLFVINLLFAQRIVRACHPHFGWAPALHYTFIGLYVLIVVSLIMLITSVVQSFYTLNDNTKRIDRDIQLYGQTLYAIISFLPFPLVLFGLVVPRKTRVEEFGQGQFRTKIAILLTSALLLCLGASYRVGVNYAGGLRPRTDPAGYQGKAPFYIINFVVDIIVIYLYILVRVDKRFFIPNGSHQAGDYLRRDDFYARRQLGKSNASDNGEARNGGIFMTEEEVFDNENPQDKDTAVDEEKGFERQQARETEAPRPQTPLEAHTTRGKVTDKSDE
ncbi:hypothetical protein P7C71_g1662, partial [Lecanoromycetidae sp. Uapishka_2]